MMKLSVAIPTYNGIDYIESLLSTLENQREVELEILIIDSSSTDGTWECIKGHPRVKAWQIPQNEFSHGKTRQSLVEKASNEVIIFLSQDAEPNSEFWAKDFGNLIQKSPENVAAFLGKQIPRKDAAPAIAQRIERTFKGIGNDFSTTIYESQNSALIRTHGKQPLQFLSDVHVAYRRNIILEKVPFAAVSYAEDQIMAANLLNNGFDIIYTGYIQALHSNNIPSSKYGQRIYDEILGLYEAIHVEYRFILGTELKQFIKNIFFDFGYLYKKIKSDGFQLLKILKDSVGIFNYEIQSLRGSLRASSTLSKSKSESNK